MNPFQDSQLSDFLILFPNLRNLDVSSTDLHCLPLDLAIVPVDGGCNFPSLPPLVKLNISSSRVEVAAFVEILNHLPFLQKLSIGALGTGRASSLYKGSTAHLLFTDGDLVGLTRVLRDKCLDLEELSLVGNTKLGLGMGGKQFSRDALKTFIREVGRRLKAS
jgi:hypothetical protein